MSGISIRCAIEGVVGAVGEVAVLPGVEVERAIGALGGQQRNDAVAVVDGAKLFGAADFRCIRAKDSRARL